MLLNVLFQPSSRHGKEFYLSKTKKKKKTKNPWKGSHQKILRLDWNSKSPIIPLLEVWNKFWYNLLIINQFCITYAGRWSPINLLSFRLGTSIHFHLFNFSTHYCMSAHYQKKPTYSICSDIKSCVVTWGYNSMIYVTVQRVGIRDLTTYQSSCW